MNKIFSVLYKLRFYLLIIFLLDIIIAVVNCVLIDINWLISFLMTFGLTLCVIFIDGLTAGVVHSLKREWFNPNHRIFQRKLSDKFYQLIKIKKWKDYIPEIGYETCGFAKDKLKDQIDSRYLWNFIEETCYGEIVHFISFFTGCLILLCNIFGNYWFISIMIVLINIIFNALSVLIQLYNRPKLLKYYEFVKRKESHSK